MTIEALDRRRLGDGPELTVVFRHAGPNCVLVLHGELHATSVAILEAQVDRLGRTPCHRVVVDLDDVTSVDETGARVLSGLRHYVRARGGHLTLVGAKPWVRIVLDAEEARSE